MNGRRPGPAGFDPNGELIPAQARNANFQRVLQYLTSDVFNSDYDALELSVERRLANRWSGRASYTLSKSHDVIGARPVQRADQQRVTTISIRGPTTA